MAGSPCTLHLKLDSSVARQLAFRQEVGNKTRHIAGRVLWLQQAVREGLLTVSVKRARHEMTRAFGVTRCLKGDMNRMAKQIAMLTIFMMPGLAEAADEDAPRASNFSLYAVTLMCSVLVLYRGLGHLQDGFGNLSSDTAASAATIVYLGC